jgi:hypothetical protein
VVGVQASKRDTNPLPCPIAGGARMWAGKDLVNPEAGPFQAGHAWEGVRASVIGFPDVEAPHFVLQRCALQPETLRSRSRTRDSSRRRL